MVIAGPFFKGAGLAQTIRRIAITQEKQIVNRE
jgi:hypothetical protein